MTDVMLLAHQPQAWGKYGQNSECPSPPGLGVGVYEGAGGGQVTPRSPSRQSLASCGTTRGDKKKKGQGNPGDRELSAPHKSSHRSPSTEEVGCLSDPREPVYSWVKFCREEIHQGGCLLGTPKPGQRRHHDTEAACT